MNTKLNDSIRTTKNNSSVTLDQLTSFKDVKYVTDFLLSFIKDNQFDSILSEKAMIGDHRGFQQVSGRIAKYFSASFNVKLSIEVIHFGRVKRLGQYCPCKIELNSKLPIRSAFFVLFHEIGHFLHDIQRYNLGVFYFSSKSAYCHIEKQCDMFAKFVYDNFAGGDSEANIATDADHIRFFKRNRDTKNVISDERGFLKGLASEGFPKNTSDVQTIDTQDVAPATVIDAQTIENEDVATEVTELVEPTADAVDSKTIENEDVATEVTELFEPTADVVDSKTISVRLHVRLRKGTISHVAPHRRTIKFDAEKQAAKLEKARQWAAKLQMWIDANLAKLEVQSKKEKSPDQLNEKIARLKVRLEKALSNILPIK